MTCILRPKCNFLNRYFRCLLPLETVDIEVKVKMMRGIHMFRRDKTSQVIKYNPWSTRLHPYPSLIQKMKTYLELEDKLGPKPRHQHQTQPQPSTSAPPQNNNSKTRKAPGPKMNEKKNQSACQEKVQSECNCPAHTIYPNSNCSSEFDTNCTYPHNSHYLHQNIHGKICCHIHPSDGV